MANPTKKTDGTDSAAAPDRDLKAAALMRQLELVSRKGEQNKLPQATSNHSFLYDSETGTPI
jgi:hypothetical protein